MSPRSAPWWLLIPWAAAACEGDVAVDIHRSDTVAFELQVAPGIVIDEVDYRIFGNGIVPIEGSIAVELEGSTASALVAGPPTGDDYLLELDAVSLDGLTTCEGSATFDVLSGARSSVTVELQCRKAKQTGGVRIEGNINVCPRITLVTAMPAATVLGREIQLHIEATDANGDSLTFFWAPSAGMITSLTDPSPRYRCSVAGAHTIAAAVSDGVCDQSFELPVTCTPSVCGDDFVSPDEECDDGNGVSGDGCSENCRIENCGNNRLETGEECDDGNRISGDGCHFDCAVEHDECLECGIESCGTEVASCDTPECQSVIGCVRDSNCSEEVPEVCYCGSGVSFTSCLMGSAAGVCKAQIESAVGSSVPTVVAERFFDPGYPIGDATQQLLCEQASCADVCFEDPGCGDGRTRAGELCDDGNTESGDGCSASCVIEPFCELAPDGGPCDATLPRWYFDADLGECALFVWGGCGGNANRFLTQAGCEQLCGD